MLYAFAGVSAAAFLLLLTARKPAFSPTMGSKTSNSAVPPSPPPSSPTHTPVFSSLDFEVFGKVQGVYFRQHVTDKADEINAKFAKAGAENQKEDILVGWVRNTAGGSVEGVAQSASAEALREFEHFVTKVGSPASRIDRFEVKNRREVERLEFQVFQRRY